MRQNLVLVNTTRLLDGNRNDTRLAPQTRRGGPSAFQAVGGLIFVLGLILLGLRLFRSGIVPRWVGVLLIAGASLNFLPLPEAPVLTGLQVELPRGLAVAIVGLLMIRASRKTTDKELIHA